MRASNGVTLFLLCAIFFENPLFAAKREDDGANYTPSPSISPATPGFLPKPESTVCEENLNPEERQIESLTSAIIVQHQNMLLRQYEADQMEQKNDHLQAMGALAQSVINNVQEIIRNSNLSTEQQQFWRLMMTSHRGLAQASRTELVEFLSQISELNELLVREGSPTLKPIMGPLLQTAIERDIVKRGDFPESKDDREAFQVVLKTVRELRMSSQSLQKRLSKAVIGNYATVPENTVKTVRNLNELLPQNPPERIVHLIQVLNSRLQEWQLSEQPVPVQDPSLPASPVSTHFVQREIFHEMIIYIREIQNYATLASVVNSTRIASIF